MHTLENNLKQLGKLSQEIDKIFQQLKEIREDAFPNRAFVSQEEIKTCMALCRLYSKIQHKIKHSQRLHTKIRELMA